MGNRWHGFLFGKCFDDDTSVGQVTEIIINLKSNRLVAAMHEGI